MVRFTNESGSVVRDYDVTTEPFFMLNIKLQVQLYRFKEIDIFVFELTTVQVELLDTFRNALNVDGCFVDSSDLLDLMKIASAIEMEAVTLSHLMPVMEHPLYVGEYPDYQLRTIHFLANGEFFNCAVYMCLQLEIPLVFLDDKNADVELFI